MATVPDRLLARPAPAAARRIATAQLDATAAACARLADRKDAEALHDFRVAVRRLRTTLRTYRQSLGRAASKKMRRRLRDLGRATNPGRDAEVQIAWLGARRDRLARRERAGLNWMLKQLKETDRGASRTARTDVRRTFLGLDATLRKRLEQIPEHGGGGGESFGAVAAPLVLARLEEVVDRLAAIAGPADDETAHEARIAGKRLRYLLEPIAKEITGGRALVRRLKALQDLLGEMHDVHVLGAELAQGIERAARAKARELHRLALADDARALDRARRRDERLGLAALAGLAQRRLEALYATFVRKWREDGGAEQLARDVRTALAAYLGPAAVPVEIERKFLLTRMPERARTAPCVAIDQGWLPGTRLQERIRRTRAADGTERYYRTVKSGAGLERVEIEEETGAGLFEQLWPLTEGRRVVKHRHEVRDAGNVWEIDVFEGRDLVLAEVEFPSRAAAERLAIPSWLQAVLDREVTGEPAYLNVNLAG
ncbi:MAG TPA: CHAD domain-containing protein [Gemmatimonadales bacterium]|nr:CHAD domain-containing protein [Gemmatimonadales bacterium]